MGIRLRHDTAGISPSTGGGGGGGGGRGSKYGLDYILQKQRMAQDMMENDRNRMFQAAMAQQDFQNRNQLALNQFDIQKQMLDFTDAKEQEREKRRAAREDAKEQRLWDRQDKTWALGNQEWDRRRGLAGDEQNAAELHAQTMAARDNIGARLDSVLKSRDDLDPKLKEQIANLAADRRNVLVSRKWDETQRKQFIDDFNTQATALLSQVPVRSPVDEANQGVRYFDQSKGQFVGGFDPEVPMTVIDQNSGLKFQSPGRQQQGPIPAEQYYQQNPEEYKKDLANEMARVQDEMDASGKPMDARAIRQEAQKRLRDNYSDDQGFFSGQGQSGGPIDEISGMVDELENVEPDKKTEVLNRLQGSKGMSDLVARAAQGDESAVQMIDRMQRAIPQKDRVESMAEALKSADPNARLQTIDEMRQLRDKGIMDDYAYTATMVKGSGQSAKSIFGNISKSKDSPLYSSVLKVGTDSKDAMTSTLNKLAGDLGMFDSRAYVRAFQSTPKIEDVVKKVAEAGKMSPEQAEEYIYKQTLAQNYSSELPDLLFTGNLNDKLDAERAKKKQASMFPDF